MQSFFRFFHTVCALGAGLAMAGCNALIDAGPPDVTGGAVVGDEDGESGAAIEPLCGNGKVDPGEQCDDGNDEASDGCFECKLGCGPKPELKDTLTGVCYRLEQAEEKTWDQAATACEIWGGTLAAVTTGDELAFVQQHVTKDTWIGGFDPAGAASFEWVTGEPWELDAFSTEPVVDEHAACVLIDGAKLGFRRDNCKLAQRYLCERAAPAAP
jgi:cysteine-rich repeat protein